MVRAIYRLYLNIRTKLITVKQPQSIFNCGKMRGENKAREGDREKECTRQKKEKRMRNIGGKQPRGAQTPAAISFFYNGRWQSAEAELFSHLVQEQVAWHVLLI